VTGFDAAGVGAALDIVRKRIRAAGGGDAVSILAVTKGFGPEAIEAAVGAGCTSIGENYAQELLSKRAALGPRADSIDVHFIGQLQTNKVRQLTELVDVYETVDRVRLASEIAKRAPNARVLIQVDTTGEPGKGGCPIDELDPLADAVLQLGLDLRGLMTVGPTTGGPEVARTGFRQVRRAVDRLGLQVCSMGMTADLEVAVQEGSTQIRVGTALFGERAVPDSHERER
jgi:pyridoxal phosphate enzyme (YggS family)